MDIEQSPAYIAFPEYVKATWLRVIQALPPAWLIAPVTGEVFKVRRTVTSICKARLCSRAAA
jgi:hypothetical protein